MKTRQDATTRQCYPDDKPSRMRAIPTMVLNLDNPLTIRFLPRYTAVVNGPAEQSLRSRLYLSTCIGGRLGP